jgi:hypothetical protein
LNKTNGGAKALPTQFKGNKNMKIRNPACCTCGNISLEERLEKYIECPYHDGEIEGEVVDWIEVEDPQPNDWQPPKCPLAGIYESNNPKYAGFIIKEEDVGFSYLGGIGDYWVVYAIPLNEDGEPYYTNAQPQRFMMGRDVGDFIPDEIEVSDECYNSVMSGE